MATRIKYAGKVYDSKSAAMVAMFEDGKTVAEVTRLFPAGNPVGYAFAYGVAKRYGFAKTAANRKPVKAVTVADGIAVIQTAAGPKKISLETGKFVR